ncbi:MAG: S9 family peptidase [Saprospiraceae bacterium]|nr:S9 family peptidase [Saprospiraceae bacterium]
MKLRSIVIFLILIIIGGDIYSQDKPFTSMDVFDLEWVTDPQISPDGNHIVYVRNAMDIMNDGKKRRIWIVNTNNGEHQKLSSDDVNEGSPRWSPDGKRIAYVAGTDEGAEVFMYWVDTRTNARISQLKSSPGSLTWSPDGKHLAMTMFVKGKELSLVRPPSKPEGAKWAPAPRVTSRLKHEADGSGYMQPGHRHIFVMPAHGGTPEQITDGDYNHGGIAWSNDGNEIYFSSNRVEDWEHNWRNSEIYSVNLETKEIATLTDRMGPDRSIAVSPDGSMIAYLGYDDRVQTYQNTLLYTMNADGSDKKQIPVDLDQGISNISWASDGSGIYFTYDQHGNTKVGMTNLDGDFKNIANDVGGVSIGRPYGGGSYSVSKGGDVAFTYTTPYHPSEVGLVRLGDSTATKVVDLNEDLLGKRNLGKVEEIWYKSSFDGRDIQGWIVYPPDYDASRKYPLIVENHGGPIANYGDRFSPEMQLYATAGYVVMYPNPRGSTSYGEEFANLLYHNYPGQDYNDVMDGVDEMVKKGIVSEDSLFVTGGSAGGIMTAWIIGKNDRFRAAAVVKPVMNWISKTLVADNYFGYANSRFPDQPWENFEGYWGFSPISLVANVKTPTLVMVGMKDLRTPPSEAKQLYHALKIRKVETALVEIPEAYHFISNKPSQLITKIEHIVAWFDRYR